MCGRYASTQQPDDLIELFEIEKLASEIREQALPPDWNIAPTKQVYAVVERPAERDGPPVRQLRTMKWGLVPSWAKSADMGAKMINARSETVFEKPAYRKAFASRRCLVPADGYYEWYTPETAPDGPKGKLRKQPFWIHTTDGSPIAFAGLYEWWRDRTRPDDDPLAWLWTCTIITTDAEPELARIHPRMPLVLEKERWDAWLDPKTGDTEQVRALLAPPEPGHMAARPVSTEVNSVKNNSPHLTEALPPEDEPGDDTLF
ncbi:SOS response-associated peptidase [Yinghuangia sp. ASG 101]|uniref:SOS response-associated peptidase n=1 Tax=Yinghuangia sp. ASG 101 TaxID=2896848 RepID=UPI001E59A420|nr:SOS response-associated peptidase [Yinghuangia sp. ASG 101]UGQ14362.1 SOS response-associated peptidase [Yinghuangia sp. ASG 101]